MHVVEGNNHAVRSFTMHPSIALHPFMLRAPTMCSRHSHHLTSNLIIHPLPPPCPGPSWLVAPVTTYQAPSRPVYLPRLDANHTWVYYFNASSVGHGGAWYNVSTPLAEFPLFFVQPVPPLVPPVGEGAQAVAL